MLNYVYNVYMCIIIMYFRSSIFPLDFSCYVLQPKFIHGKLGYHFYLLDMGLNLQDGEASELMTLFHLSADDAKILEIKNWNLQILDTLLWIMFISMTFAVLCAEMDLRPSRT